MSKRLFSFLFIFMSFYNIVSAQKNDLSKDLFLRPSDTLDMPRFYFATISAVGSYSIASIGLYNSWYKSNEIGKFHFFNDNKEWGFMDKYGHFYSTYVESVLAYKASKWAGLSEKSSILTGIVTGSVIQTTIEIMDGFSNKWGFSIADMGMNTIGLSTFYLQQKHWKEQRIIFKVSSYPKNYETNKILSTDGFSSTSLDIRANDLFGTSYVGRYLKDYNAQTYWTSINISSFLPENIKFPKYLNLALGYGAENMYGGFENLWIKNGFEYKLNEEEYQRYHQFYIGLDIDFTRIKTKSYFLKSVFNTINLFKVPSPAIEINTKGEIIFHLLKI